MRVQNPKSAVMGMMYMNQLRTFIKVSLKDDVLDGRWQKN